MIKTAIERIPLAIIQSYIERNIKSVINNLLIELIEKKFKKLHKMNFICDMPLSMLTSIVKYCKSPNVGALT